MNKHFKKVILTILSLALVLSMIGLVACKDDKESVSAPIDIVETEISVVQHMTKNLSLTYSGTDSVVWSSSDTSIATVSNGVVTGLKVGSTIVTVKAGEATDTCAIKVLAIDVSALSISVSKSSIELSKGESEKITASMLYNGQNVVAEFSYFSGNEAVAIVSSDGTVSAKAAGQASIIVKGSFAGVSVNTIVNVNVESDIQLSVDNDEIVLHYEADEQKGYINTFTPEITCIDNGNVIVDPELEYEIIEYEGETDVFTIENGVITAKNSGSALLSIIYESQSGEKANVVLAVRVYAAQKDLDIYPIQIDVSSENEWFDYSSISQVAEDIISARIIVENSIEDLQLDASQTKVQIGNNHGTCMLVLESRRYAYNVPITVCFTYVISRESISSLKWASDEKVVLVEDIDMADYFELTGETIWETNAVFTGEFDGNGFVINNLVTGKTNGLFKSFGGVIKNVGFKNAVSNGSGIIANDNVADKDITIENVAIKVISVSIDSDAETEEVEPYGALLKAVDNTCELTATNVAIKLPETTDTSWGFIAGTTDATFALNNCNFVDGNGQTFGVSSNSQQVVGAPEFYEGLENLYSVINADGACETLKNAFNKVFVLEISNDNRDLISTLTDEYVVLVEDVAFDFNVEKEKIKFSNTTFTGVFDGCGHSISGLCLRNYDGLFCKLGGIVKNLSISAAVRGNFTGVIASELCGDAKVSDVYVRATQPIAAPNQHSGIVWSVDSGYKLNVSNCYVEVDRSVAAEETDAVKGSQAFVSVQVSGELILNNCYFYRWYQGIIAEGKGEVSNSSANYGIYDNENDLINDIMDNKIDLGAVVENFIYPITHVYQNNINEFMNATEGVWCLAEDIDMSGVEWNKVQFNGVFDGRGHSISNLSTAFLGSGRGISATIKNVAFINDSSANTLYTDLNGCNIIVENVYFNRVGVFGQFTGAIKEVRGTSTLTFKNCAVYSQETGSNSRAGLFAGRADGGLLVFDNCYGIIADASKCSSTIVYNSHSGSIQVTGTADVDYFVRASIATLVAEALTNTSIDLSSSMLAKYIK